MSHAIETLSGSMFDYDDPRSEDICINDIATALGNTSRFGGHTSRYYSVAEHAVLVHRLVRDAGFPDDVCFAALHHDSHEAYLGDVPTPLKRLLGDGWKYLEMQVDFAIDEALGVNCGLMKHDAVKCADARAMAYEAAKLKPSGKIIGHGAWKVIPANEVPASAVVGWSPREAARFFLAAHEKAARLCS